MQNVPVKKSVLIGMMSFIYSVFTIRVMLSFIGYLTIGYY